MKLEVFAEEYCGKMYNSKLDADQQCSGWYELKKMVENNIEPTDENMSVFHENLRKKLRENWADLIATFHNAPPQYKFNILEEFIICAAIHLDDGKKYDSMPENIETGIVITGRRHGDCYTVLKVLNAEYWKNYDNGRENQGFLTSKNRYLSRNEAFLIAQKQGQIFHKMHDGKTSEILVSEDLY